MTRQEKESYIETLKKKYTVETVINKHHQDVAVIDLGPLDIPEDFTKEKMGLPIIRKVDGEYHVIYSVQLGLNKKEKAQRQQERQKKKDAKKELKSKIKDMTKECVGLLKGKNKDPVKAQEIIAKIEQAETDLAAL